MIDHSQCLPWCGHLMALEETLADRLRRAARYRRVLALLERDIAEREMQIRLMKAAGARS